jgi:hypothetical protein
VSEAATITIDTDATCPECGGKGTADSGICIGCITKAVSGGPMRSPLGQAVQQRFNERRQSGADQSLEELLGRASGCLDADHSAMWLFGDLVNAAIDNARPRCPNPRAFRAARSSIYRSFAGLRKSTTTAFVRQYAERSGTFGTEQRLPDVSFSLYRATMNAAKRLNRDARELLDEVLQRDLSVGDVNALGKEEPEEAVLKDECGDCGAEIAIRMRKQGIRVGMVGLVVPCGVCVATAIRDGRDPREAKALGALE